MDRVTSSDRDTRMDSEGLPRHVLLASGSATYQMKPSDNVISFVSSLADDLGIVTLPSLAEAVGQFYYLVAPTGAAGNDISLYEKETGAELATNGDMDADGDYLILFSDGTAWRTITDGVA